MTTEAALRSARCRPRRQRLDVELSPLVVSRPEARLRGSRAEIVTILAWAVGLVAWMFLAVNDEDQVWSIGITIVLIGMQPGFWWRRRLERPLPAERAARCAPK